MSTIKLQIVNEKPYPCRNIEVEVTDESGATYKSWMTKEEYKLRSMLLTLYKTLGPLVTAELTEAIEDYAQVKYEDGYDNANMDESY